MTRQCVELKIIVARMQKFRITKDDKLMVLIERILEILQTHQWQQREYWDAMAARAVLPRFEWSLQEKEKAYQESTSKLPDVWEEFMKTVINIPTPRLRKSWSKARSSLLTLGRHGQSGVRSHMMAPAVCLEKGW